MRKLLSFFLVLLATLALAQAQDRIYRINPKEVINCKIIEISEEFVKYIDHKVGPDVVMVIYKDVVTKIEFGNGTVISLSAGLIDPRNYESQNKNALKLSFFSPMLGSTFLSYERSIKPGQSIEAGVGIIGLGIDGIDIDPRGIALKVGYKFLKSPQWYNSKNRYSHILKGSYIMPELSFVSFSGESSNYYYDTYNSPSYDVYYDRGSREKNTLFSLSVVFGKQWVFADRFMVDLFFGLGYAFGENNLQTPWNYAFLGGTYDDTPLCASIGMRLGFVF